VRGNLPVNYRMDYGRIGGPVAAAHLKALRRLDYVVAMTHAMAAQVRRYTGRMPDIIANFIDEAPVEQYRRSDIAPGAGYRFVFLASLTERKQPVSVVDAFAALCGAGFNACLDIVGDGPLRDRVSQQIARLGLQASVVLHGHLDNPYSLVAQADVMVLPSLSEGMPRAALEALHLGIPCVLRAVDGNAELIEEGVNGALFTSDTDLAPVMARTVQWARARRGPTRSLLPEHCRQRPAALRYLALVDGAHD
jgi:glycosyltransferase involved in cell wall biosynthesis